MEIWTFLRLILQLSMHQYQCTSTIPFSLIFHYFDIKKHVYFRSLGVRGLGVRGLGVGGSSSGVFGLGVWGQVNMTCHKELGMNFLAMHKTANPFRHLDLTTLIMGWAIGHKGHEIRAEEDD